MSSEEIERYVGDLIDHANSAHQAGTLSDQEYERRMDQIGIIRLERLADLDD